MKPFPLTTEFLSYFHEDWMADEEMVAFNNQTLEAVGHTYESMEQYLPGCLTEGYTLKGLAQASKLEARKLRGGV